MVFVLSSDQQPLDPTQPARARALLRKGRAIVVRRFPFTIRLLDRTRADSATSPFRLKLDPGSTTTGLAVLNDQTGQVVFAAELHHRGQQVRDALLARRMFRRNRRERKTRYRAARFDNRSRPAGWLAPSLQSRVDNVLTWVRRLQARIPLTAISMELVRFDTQLLQEPTISGVQYQQGTLLGYELREYLLERWRRTCAYCGSTTVPLQIEHIVPRSRGGSDRVSNLTLACKPCNLAKGNQTAAEYGHAQLHDQARQPLRNAAAINSTRWALWARLQATGLPVEVSTGGQTGDMVRAVVPGGKHAGRHEGRVAVRSSGSFNITTASGTLQGISQRHCRVVQRADGYRYALYTMHSLFAGLKQTEDSLDRIAPTGRRVPIGHGKAANFLRIFL